MLFLLELLPLSAHSSRAHNGVVFGLQVTAVIIADNRFGSLAELVKGT